MSETVTCRTSNRPVQRDVWTDDRTCPECAASDLRRTPNETELVCRNCGLVVAGPAVYAGATRRPGGVSERQQSRVGPPLTRRRHDEGLATTIDWRDEDAYGTALPSGKRRRMARLRNWQQRCRVNGSDERNLRFAFGEIDRIASVVGLPDAVRETASVTYRRALSANIVGSYSTESVASSVLYIACRVEGLPRTMTEIAAASRVAKRKIGRAYRQMSRELDIDLAPIDPRQYLPQLCSTLDCSEQVRIEAADIIETAAEEGLLASKTPMGCAAAAVYLASMHCDEKRTQRDIATVAGVSVETLRSRYHEQREAATAGEGDV